MGGIPKGIPCLHKGRAGGAGLKPRRIDTSEARAYHELEQRDPLSTPSEAKWYPTPPILTARHAERPKASALWFFFWPPEPQ